MNLYPRSPNPADAIEFQPDPSLTAKARVGIAVMKAKRDHLTILAASPTAAIESDISTWFLENGDAA